MWCAVPGAADKEKLYEAVFDASLAKLDIFSRYAGAVEAAEHRAAREGFGGIGIRYEPHQDDIVLTEVMPETPAADANLQVGDHITAIDGTNVAGLDQAEISKRLRGPVASAVTLTMKKKDLATASRVGLERRLIVPPTVKMAMKDGIATIAISSFNRTTAANAAADVKKAKAGRRISRESSSICAAIRAACSIKASPSPTCSWTTVASSRPRGVIRLRCKSTTPSLAIPGRTSGWWY